MATVSHDPNFPAQNVVEYDRFIEDQLRRTRSQVRLVDLSVSLLTFVLLAMIYILLAVLADHWLFSAGLGFWGRFLAMSGFIGGCGFFVIFYILPYLFRRINPVYAAHTIERGAPSLKNALINFMLLRRDRRGVSKLVFEAVEEQAAAGLNRVPVDLLIDRTRLLRLSYALMGVVFLAAAYMLFSPKPPLQSVARIFSPWADLQKPTRVDINEIQPGSAKVFRGERETISCELRGLRADEQPSVFYTTADRQVVDRAVPMYLPKDAYRWECKLPIGDGGLQQDLEYRVAAGDAVSRTYKLTVVAAPTIDVDRVDYAYPAYTGIARRSDADKPDIKALEGTKVTIHATANQPIKSASISFNGNVRSPAPMAFDSQGQTATYTVTLALRRDANGKLVEPLAPAYSSYAVRFVNLDGKQNPQATEHKIEVTRDLPPDVKFVSPDRDGITHPLNQKLKMAVRASDPDFGLTEVTVQAGLNAGNLNWQKVLFQLDPKRAADRQQFLGQDEFNGTAEFDPSSLGLKEGSVIYYRAIARDNREPEANQTETDVRKITLIAPQAAPPQQPDNPNRPDPANQPAGNPQDQQAGEPRPGEQNPKAGERPNSAPNDANNRDLQQNPNHKLDPRDQQPQREENRDPQNEAKPADPMLPRNPGEKASDAEAIQRLLDKQRREEQQRDQQQRNEPNQPAGKSPDQRSQPDQSPSADQPAGGDSRPDNASKPQQPDKPAEQNKQQPGGANKQPQPAEGNKQQSSDNKAGGKPDGQQKPQDSKQPDSNSQQNKPGDQAGNQPNAGNQPQDNPKNNASQQPGKSPSDKQDGAGKQQNASKPDGSQKQNPDDKQQPGDNASKPNGDKQQGDKQGGDKQGGDKQGGDKQGGDKQGGDKQGGDKQGGDKQSGDKQGGDKSGQKPGGDKSADKQNGGQPGDNKQGDKPAGQGDKPGEQPGKPDGQNDKSNGSGNKPDGNPGPSDGQGQKPGEKAQPSPQKPDPGAKPSPGQAPADDPGMKADKADNQSSKQGDGGKSNDGGLGGDKPQKSDQQAGDPKQKGGDEKPKGDSGAGSGGKPEGSPSPQDQQKLTNNKPQDQQPNSTDKNDAQSPGHGKESKSQGKSEAGDAIGSGQTGGGQGSNKAGTGGNGQNTASETGTGRAQEPGKGELSNQPGADAKSDKGTDRAGPKAAGQDKVGDGNRPAAGGNQQGKAEKPGDQPADPAADKSGQQPGPNGQSPNPSGSPSNQPGGNAGGTGIPQGGGQTAGAGGPGNVGKEPGADEANLEFAKKATDLVLDKLKHQEAEPDPELLKQLGWSKDDMRRFIQRWEQMKREAEKPGPDGDAARQQYNDALQSLGVRPGKVSRAADRSANDQQRGLNDARRSKPPVEYAEQFRAYTQGVSKGSK